MNRSPTVDARDRALLRAAVLNDARGEAAWSQVRDSFDPDRLPSGAPSLLPMLGANLERLDPGFHDLPRLRGIRRHTWVANQCAAVDVLGAIALLRSEGIDAVVAGSLALVALVDPEPGARAVGVPEILVRPAEWVASQRRLEAAGWDRRPDPTLPDAVTSVVMLRRDGRAIVVARSPRPMPARRDVAESTFWTGRESAELGETPVLVVGPSESTVVAAARAWMTRGGGRLEALADVHALVSRGGVRWDRAVECAREQQVTVPVRLGLDLAVAALDLPVPPTTMDALASTRVGPRVRFADRVGQITPGRLPVVGGAPYTVARSVAITAYLPMHRAVPVAAEFVGRRWRIKARRRRGRS